MTKPIQLRSLIGLLGFEPDVAKLYNDEEFDDKLREFLESLESEMKDKWVTVMAGIIREKLFSNEDATQHDSQLDNGRNKKTDKMIIKKAVEGIINSLTDASSDAVAFRNEAEVALTTSDPSEEDEKNMEKLLDSFHIGTDVYPDFLPWPYRLCSENVITEAIPELDERCDFIVNEEADILKVDERLDRRKAQEEAREEEQKEKVKALAEEKKRRMAEANARNPQPQPAKLKGTAGVNIASSKVDDGSDHASLMMRTKKKGGSKPPASMGLSGRLGSKTAAGVRARPSGFGRGAAANAIGGRNLSNSMSRMRKPGAMKRPGMSSGTTINAGRAAHRNKTKMKTIDFSEVDTLKKEGEKRQQKLTEEEKRENKRRKIRENAIAGGLKLKGQYGDRKVGTMKNGNSITEVVKPQNSGQNGVAPSNLDASNAFTANTNNSNGNMTHNIQMQHPAAIDQSFIPMLSASEIDLNSMNLNLLNMDQNELLNQQHHMSSNNMAISQYQSGQDIHLASHEFSQMNTDMQSQNFSYQQNYQQQQSQQPQPQQPQPQHQVQYHQQPLDHNQDWHLLLQRSNKLTSEDRMRVEQFFTTNPRFNPTPDISKTKLKLHESRTVDPNTNQSIKETLYLELDYETGAYKMSRKKKEKAMQR